MNEPITVVIPAFNEEESIAEVTRGVAEALRDRETEILVVDDGSRDATAERAREAGARVVPHPANRGYGAALKTGIRQASHEWIALIDADGQHDARDILRLMEAVGERFDMMIGARDESSFQYASRMPGKRILQWIAAFLVGERPDDVNSGLRVFRKRDATPYFSILPNGFSFTTTLTLAMIKDALRVGFIPIQTSDRKGRPSTVSLRDGFTTLLLILRIATLFNPLKVFLPISVTLFVLGAVYGAGNILFNELNIPDGASLLVITSIVVFFFGLLADQLASMRRGG